MSASHRYYPVFIGRIFFLFAATLLPATAASQTADSVEARAAQAVLDVREGNIVATSIIVTNSSRRQKTFKGRIALPTGWRTVTRESQFSLAPGRSDSRLISFFLPPETPAGLYPVKYYLADITSPEKERETAFEVHVIASKKLEIKVLQAPRFVVAGKDYAVQYTIANLGNVTGTVRLHVRNSESFRVTLDSSRLQLGPRQTRTVTALVMTSGSLQNKVISTLEVSATLEQDTAFTVRASSVVDVIPQVSSITDRYLEFPIEITGRASGEDDRLGGQIEIAGAGSLTEERNDRLQLMLRFPDIQSQSSIGLRDEYRVRYASSWVEIQGGDWSYSLSPLTELNRYAFGGQGAARYHGVTAGGFFNQSRFVTDGPQQAAGFIKYELAEHYELGVNFLKKKELNEDNVASIRGILKPLALANLDLEYGTSDGVRGKDKAYAVQVSGKQQVVAYDFKFIRSGPKYAGYYRDVDYDLLTVNIFPLDDVRFEALYRSEERNKDRDTTFFYAPQERFLQIGGGYSNIFAVSFRSTTQRDLLPSAQYNRKEDMVQLRGGHAFRGVDLYANVDLGSTNDRKGNISYPFRRYALFAGINPEPGQNYSSSVEYSTERNFFDGSSQKRLSLSLGASIFINYYTNIQGTLFWSRTYQPTRQDFALLDVTMQHLFPFGHRIAVRARQNFSTPAINGRELAYTLQYSVPLGVPVKRLSSTGQLRGRVLNETGKGIGNILINVSGSAAITDSDGDFFFPTLAPGQHYLILDKVSIGIDRVATQMTPMKVDIAGGKETELTINLVRSSNVSGTVVLNAFDELDSSKTKFVEVGPKSGVLLELSNDREFLRRVSDNRGRFVFADLRPGAWVLRVVGGDIPQYHEVEQNAWDVSLTPGSKKEFTLNIRPRKRAIRIIEEATVPPVSRQPEPFRIAPGEDFLISYSNTLRGFVLQISSWETSAKASEHARIVEEASGLKALIERTDVAGIGRRYRVRVGPFQSRQKAEEFARKWKDPEKRE